MSGLSDTHVRDLGIRPRERNVVVLRRAIIRFGAIKRLRNETRALKRFDDDYRMICLAAGLCQRRCVVIAGVVQKPKGKMTE